MSFLFGGHLSTDKLILQFLYIFIVPFPVWAGIILIQFPVWLEFILIPAQTENEAMKMNTDCKTGVSVDS